MSKPSHSDHYEQEYMAAGQALARQRIPMAWWGHGIFAAALALVARLAYAQPRAPLFVAMAFITLLWLLFMTLRVAVTRTHLHVQLGFFGPKIPINRIEQARACSGPRFRTGWGIRLGLDGAVTYSVPAPTKQCLEVVYRTDTGSRQRTVRVMTDDPEPLVAAIDAARAQGSAALTQRVRVSAQGSVLAPDAQAEPEAVAAHSVTTEKR